MNVKRVVVVTGLSGAGKASILRALEDLGYNAVDNPPLTLVETLITRADQPMAIGLDTRSRGFDAEAGALDRDAGSRRRPASASSWSTPGPTRPSCCAATPRPGAGTRWRRKAAWSTASAPRKRSTRPLRDDADLVIDTSELPVGRTAAPHRASVPARAWPKTAECRA